MPDYEEEKYPDLNEDIELTEYSGDHPPGPQKDYDPSVIAYIFGQQDFSSWSEVLTWLKENSIHDPVLGSDETRYLESDIDRLVQDKVPFTNNPAEVTALAKKTRSKIDGYDDEEHFGRSHS
jgi:hypothetical protein